MQGILFQLALGIAASVLVIKLTLHVLEYLVPYDDDMDGGAH